MTKKSRQPVKSKEENVHLEDTLATLTTDIGKFVRKYRIPLIVVVVLVVAGLAFGSIFSEIRDSREEGWGARIYEVFSGSDSEIRSGAPKLLKEFRGKKIEPYIIVRYCNWLNLTNEGDDRTQALRLIREAVERFPNGLQIQVLAELCEQFARDASFQVPAPPVIEVPPTPLLQDPPPAEPATPEGSSGEAGAGDGGSTTPPDDRPQPENPPPGDGGD